MGAVFVHIISVNYHILPFTMSIIIDLSVLAKYVIHSGTLTTVDTIHLYQHHQLFEKQFLTYDSGVEVLVLDHLFLFRNQAIQNNCIGFSCHHASIDDYYLINNN